MDGRAGTPRPPQKNVKPQGNGALERQMTKIFQKSPVQKNVIFAPLKTNGRADGNQKEAFPNKADALYIYNQTTI